MHYLTILSILPFISVAYGACHWAEYDLGVIIPYWFIWFVVSHCTWSLCSYCLYLCRELWYIRLRGCPVYNDDLVHCNSSRNDLSRWHYRCYICSAVGTACYLYFPSSLSNPSHSWRLHHDGITNWRSRLNGRVGLHHRLPMSMRHKGHSRIPHCLSFLIEGFSFLLARREDRCLLQLRNLLVHR
jgi:hypothetical protein